MTDAIYLHFFRPHYLLFSLPFLTPFFLSHIPFPIFSFLSTYQTFFVPLQFIFFIRSSFFCLFALSPVYIVTVSPVCEHAQTLKNVAVVVFKRKVLARRFTVQRSRNIFHSASRWRRERFLKGRCWCKEAKEWMNLSNFVHLSRHIKRKRNTPTRTHSDRRLAHACSSQRRLLHAHIVYTHKPLFEHLACIGG